MDYLADLLAEHALSIDVTTLDAKVCDASLRCLFDALTAAMAGQGAAGPVAARQALPLLYGSGAFPLWFSGETAPLLGALLHNGLCTSALDLDDGNRLARGHPGASVIPAVLTLAAMRGGTRVHDILSSIIAGYDVGLRIAAAQRPEAIPTRQTGRWAAFAACAAAGRLLKVSQPHLAQGLSIAGVLAPNQRANGSSGYSKLTGNLVKEGIAFSAQTGLQALFLAGHGFDGPVDLLDHPGFYDPDVVTAGLGERFLISETYFKPYACCRYIHPALDALLGLQQRHGFGGQEIAQIRVHTFRQALRLANGRDPDGPVALQYSLPFCLALLAVEGEEALLSPGSAFIGRPDLVALSHRVELLSDGEAERRFPRQTLARLDVRLTSGLQLSSNLTGTRGDPDQPLTAAEHRQKFLTATASNLSEDEQKQAQLAFECFAGGEPLPLLEVLACKSQGPPAPMVA